jgi:hypothetical protein
MVYGATIKPGYSQLDGSVLDIASAFQSFGELTISTHQFSLRAGWPAYTALASSVKKDTVATCTHLATSFKLLICICRRVRCRPGD